MAKDPKSSRRRESGPPQLGMQLRDAALRRGLSVSALSAAADVDRRVVGQWLKGVKDITLTTAGRIAAALGLRLAEGPGRKPPRPSPATEPRTVFEAMRAVSIASESHHGEDPCGTRPDCDSDPS